MGPGEHNQKCEILLPWEAWIWICFMRFSFYVHPGEFPLEACISSYSHATLSQYIRWSLTRFFGWVLLDNVDGEHPFTSENFLNLCEQVTVIDMMQHWAYTIMRYIISHFVLQHSKWIHLISIWIWSVHWFGRYIETLSFVFVICQIQLLFSAMLLRNHIKWVMEMLRSTEWEHFEKGNVRHIVRQSWKKVVNLLISRFTDN